jgi:hypothetical protein
MVCRIVMIMIMRRIIGLIIRFDISIMNKLFFLLNSSTFKFSGLALPNNLSKNCLLIRDNNNLIYFDF